MRQHLICIFIGTMMTVAGCNAPQNDNQPATPSTESVSTNASDIKRDITDITPRNTEKTDTFVVVMLGDSITAGLGLQNARQLTDGLQAIVDQTERPVTLINAGVSGDRMQDAAARFDWSVGPDADGVVIALGGNDLLRGIEPSVTRAHLQAMLAKAHERNLWVAVLAIPAPGNATPAFASEFNAVFQDLSDEYCIPLYGNLLDGVIGNPDLNQADGIHPNPAGVEVIIGNLGPWLKAALDGHHNPC